MLRLSETHSFFQSSSFWEARCALIGQLSSVLWLAEYLKRVTEMLRPLPYCDAVSRHDDTKTIKPIVNEAFVASSGDIITDYNVLYCLGVTLNSRRFDALIGRAWFDSKSHSRIFTGCYYDHAILAVWGGAEMSDFT